MGALSGLIRLTSVGWLKVFLELYNKIFYKASGIDTISNLGGEFNKQCIILPIIDQTKRVLSDNLIYICEEDKGQYDQSEPIFWASGAALFIRSSVFHEVKGFDEYFFAHQEEIDMCWRIQLAGYQIYSCPAVSVFHVGGGTLPRGNTLKTYLNLL